MLNNGCVSSESGQTMTTADFRFTRVMAEQAARARLTLDDDQLSLIARLDARASSCCPRPARRRDCTFGDAPGEGKLYSRPLFASLPLAAGRRVHFHHFFRELHQRLNAPARPA